MTEDWRQKFDDKFGAMLEHRLYHYGIAHFRDIGREPTKAEEDECLKFAKWQVNEIETFIANLLTTRTEQAVAEERENKDGAYHERDMLVCALSKLFPAYLARHSDEDKDWEDEWRWIVYIELPTGQVSWHIHEKERAMFDHLEVKENNWDGHNTDRKYQRLTALSALQDPRRGGESG